MKPRPKRRLPTEAAQLLPGSHEDVLGHLIRKIWPDHLEEKALSIAWRESNHRPDVNNYCCYGLFQIYFSVHQSWLADLGINQAEHLFDARLNTIAAYTLYQQAGGWGPWGG